MADDQNIPSTFRLIAGLEVSHSGERRIYLRQISLKLALIEDPVSGERHQVSVGELTLHRPADTCEGRKIPDLQIIPEHKRAEGLRRQKAIDGLLRMKYRTRQDVAHVAEELDLGVSHFYALMKRYLRHGTWTCLIPHCQQGRPRKKRLSALAEDITKEVIDELFMTRNSAPIAEVVREVARRCKRAALKPPAPNSVRARIRALDPEKVVAAREGAKAARDRFGTVLGSHDEPRWPGQRWEIDHTVADIYLVDEQERLPIARPVLTVVIDVFSRMVVGFHVSLRAPSTLSVALALTNAVLPKNEFLCTHGIESPWDCVGLPDVLFSDNAAEFDSRGLKEGCAQYGIHGEFRPLGRPHFGGRVERLIGTLMGRIQLMPGATMRSVAARGEGYDPEQHAAYTLKELETRLASEICDVYHRTVHGGTGVTPLDLYTFGIVGDDKTPGRGMLPQPSDPTRFLLDFLPVERRSVQPYGLQIGHLRFHAPILRGLPKRMSNGEDYIVRYDPRDLSRVWLYVPEEGYYEIPRAQAHFPKIALWEVDAAIKHLRDQGQKPNDELVIQRAIERLRTMDEEAVRKSKKARKRMEMRRLDSAAITARPSSPKPEATDESVVPPHPIVTRPKIRPISDVEGW